MTRRGLIGLLPGMVAAATFDPDRLLYVPGKIHYSIPAPLKETYYRFRLVDTPLTERLSQFETHMDKYVRGKWVNLPEGTLPSIENPHHLRRLVLPDWVDVPLEKDVPPGSIVSAGVAIVSTERGSRFKHFRRYQLDTPAYR